MDLGLLSQFCIVFVNHLRLLRLKPLQDVQEHLRIVVIYMVRSLPAMSASHDDDRKFWL